MAAFKTILSDVGTAIKKFFGVAVKDAATVAQDVEPIIQLAFPGIAGLYTSTVTAVMNAENASIAAGAQSGTGAQKLTAAVAEIEPDFLAWAVKNGINVSGATVAAWVTAVVSTLNTIPAMNQPVSSVAQVPSGVANPPAAPLV